MTTLHLYILLSCLIALALCSTPKDKSSIPAQANKISAIIVVLAYDRASHLRKTLRSLVAAATPRLANHFPIYVSVDDNPRAGR